jgi:hypothetical protein
MSFLPFLQGMDVQFEELFFQDDTRLHTGKPLLDGVSILTIILSVVWSWLQYSPHLNLCGRFLWRNLKDGVYRQKQLYTVDERKK